MKFDNLLLVSVATIAILSFVLISKDGGLGFSGSQLNPIPNNADQLTVARNSYSEELDKLFNLYEKIFHEEEQAFNQQLKNQWGEAKTSTRTQWISYVDNENVRREVDYETGKIDVDMLLPDSNLVPSHIKNKLDKEIYRLLSTTEAEAFKLDTVAKKVEARLPNNPRFIKRDTPDNRPLFNLEKLANLSLEQTSFVKVKNVLPGKITMTIGKSIIPGKVIAHASLTAQKEMLERAGEYEDEVRKYARKHKVSPALIYAIMESESHFNPMARSHIPAYGLMQIVPNSAGRDATRHLYGKPKLLAPSFLYKSENNINIGTAYLHVLYYEYMNGIKNTKSRIYCTIAAYNSGASNVARAFIRYKNLQRATKTINRKSPAAVYHALTRKLPFRETRKYVKKVTRNMEKYIQMYAKNKSI